MNTSREYHGKTNIKSGKMAKFTEIKSLRMVYRSSGKEYVVTMQDGTEKVVTEEQFDLTNDKLNTMWGLSEVI